MKSKSELQKQTNKIPKVLKSKTFMNSRKLKKKIPRKLDKHLNQRSFNRSTVIDFEPFPPLNHEKCLLLLSTTAVVEFQSP